MTFVFALMLCSYLVRAHTQLDTNLLLPLLLNNRTRGTYTLTLHVKALYVSVQADDGNAGPDTT